ncbi:MAG: signal recognition particle protein [Deltaproteobacteria bacterium]|nr:signal recognition particle protein [Deltaproteobacteria bacterium]
MFDVLSRGFKSARLALQGKAQLDEENIAPALREVRSSLLQADVELGVVKDFLDKVKAASLGEIVPVKTPSGPVKVSPQDWFVKACYDALVELMGPVDTTLDLTGGPAVILMVGLQGSGKTTTAGKLARRLAAQGKKPMLVAADIYRPAAVEQLMVLGRKLNVPVFSIKGMSPVNLAKMAVTQARNVGRDVVIIDTAGRLAIDDTLMTELDEIKAATKPKNILFVCDAMIGQDAVRTAAEFDRRLAFTGFVLTKLDGDARGGAALSIKAVTGKPVKFLGQGEDLDKLEEFRPEGLAQRILGFGDIVGLMQDFEKHVDKDTAEKDAEKMLKGDFGYGDFVGQLQMVRKIGPLKEIMSRIPFMGELLDKVPTEALDDKEIDRTLAVISSMTKQERARPDVLTKSPSRIKRIAKGCGRTEADVKELHERFLQARQMMKGLGGLMSNPKELERLQKQMQQMASGGAPGGGGGGAAKPELSAAEKLARHEKLKEERRNRKRNR